MFLIYINTLTIDAAFSRTFSVLRFCFWGCSIRCLSLKSVDGWVEDDEDDCLLDWSLEIK